MSSDAAAHAVFGSRPRMLAGRSRSAPSRLREDPQTAQAAAFRALVWRYWKKNGRHNLPWRQTHDPYKILVSEVMLQQTQVDRVIPYYEKFLKAFPMVRALARASLTDVLKVWSGLGYNRRAKFLRDAAKMIVERYDGKIPLLYSELVELPGVGDYTAGAVRVFAFNEPDILIETNIRTVFIHHFHKGLTFVEDKDILSVVRKVSEGQDPREWHWALMDYGAYLKASGVRVNARSAHYMKQSRFEGSLRQVRGAVLRVLNGVSKTERELRSDLGESLRSDLEKFKSALMSLARDGLIVREKGKWRIV